MATKSQRQNGRESAVLSLNVAIYALNFAKDILEITPAKAAFGSAGFLLTTIRVGFLPSGVVDCWLICTGLNDERSKLRQTGDSLR